MAEYDRHLLDGEHLGHLVGKIKAADATKITDPASKADGNFLKYNGTTWVAANVPDTGVLTVTASNGTIIVDNTDAANPKVGVGSITLAKVTDAGTAAAKAYTSAVTSGSTDLVTSGAVFDAISAISTFRFEIVQTLPQTGETNVIYLVPKSQGPQTNLYIEYAYINNAWEQLGDTQITLEYLTNAEIDTIWQNS